MTLKPTKNLLFETSTGNVEMSDLAKIKSVHRRKLNTAKRELRDLRKGQAATEAIAGLDHDCEIFGFTKGQFSLLDLLGAVLKITGPVHLSLSTWTAAAFEIQTLGTWLARGDLLGVRMLIDFSMARREPAMTSQLRDTIGRDSVRVAQTHAKFAVFQNPEWKVVLRSSMNLNMNPRYEDFQIAHDPELANFLNNILDAIWQKQTKEIADDRPYEIVKHFRDDL